MSGDRIGIVGVMTILIIGLGNRHRGDDAVGTLLLDRLADLPCDRLVAGEDLSRLLDRWPEYRLVVVVDALRPAGQPGQVSRAEWPRMGNIKHDRLSPQAANLIETARAAERLGCLPENLVYYGVEGTVFKLGQPMSEAVSGALAELEKKVRGEIMGALR